jgi:hypothetical protein
MLLYTLQNAFATSYGTVHHLAPLPFAINFFLVLECYRRWIISARSYPFRQIIGCQKTPDLLIELSNKLIKYGVAVGIILAIMERFFYLLWKYSMTLKF